MVFLYRMTLSLSKLDLADEGMKNCDEKKMEFMFKCDDSDSRRLCAVGLCAF